MSWLFIFALKNAILVAPLALVAFGLARWSKRPALAHLVWVLVLVKLVTPPLVNVPVGWQLNVERWVADAPAAASPQPPPASRTVKHATANSAAPARTIAARAHATADSALSAPPAFTARLQASRGDGRRFASAADASAAPAWHAFAGLLPRSAADWLALAGIIWLAGSAALVVLMALRAWRFHRFLHIGGHDDARLARRVHQLAHAAGLSAEPRVVVVASAVSPMLWGLGGRTTLIFPAALRERLSDDEIDSLLLHELAHFARGDHWVRLLELATHVLYWWHPVVWFARREIEIAEESCCDAWVVEHQFGSRRSYAEALLATIDFLSEQVPALPPAACGLGDVPLLRQRLTQIVRGETATKLPRAATILIVCAGLFLSPLEPALWATSSPRQQPPQPAATPAPRPSPIASLAAMAGPATPSPVLPAASLPESIPEPGEVPAPVDPIIAPPAALWATATSPDGRYKLEARREVAAGRRTTLVHAGTTWRLDLSAHGIACVSFAPTGQSFVTGHDDGSLRWWDSATGGLLTDPLQLGSGKITSVALADDSRRVACGSATGRVSIADLATGQEVARLDAAAAIGCVRWSHGGDELAIGVGSWAASEQAALLVWNPATVQPRHELALTAPAGAIDWLPGDASLLVAAWNGQSTVWHFDSESLVESVVLEKDAVSAAAWSPDCPLAAGWRAGNPVPGALR